MNKTMQKLTAALLALCCLPVTGMTAAAADLPYVYGDTKWDAFEGEEPINDHGMLTRENGVLYEGKGFAYLLTPHQNEIRFYPYPDADIEATAMQIAEVLDEFIPGLKDGFDEKTYQSSGSLIFQTESVELYGGTCYTYASGEKRWIFHGYNLSFRDPLPENKEELEANILLALARKHLISSFYGFGEIAEYSECYFDPDLSNGIWYIETEDLPEEKVEIIQAYLAECYPDYSFELSETKTATGYTTCYGIVGTEPLSFREKIELAGELYENFGLRVWSYSPNAESDNSTTGHNALERRGDVTLDTDLSIIDVIALNRNLMTNDPLCNTAVKNADIDGDGTPDETDALAILKEVVEITQDFKES